MSAHQPIEVHEFTKKAVEQMSGQLNLVTCEPFRRVPALKCWILMGLLSIYNDADLRKTCINVVSGKSGNTFLLLSSCSYFSYCMHRACVRLRKSDVTISCLSHKLVSERAVFFQLSGRPTEGRKEPTC